MNRELIGFEDKNMTHEFSGFIAIRRYEGFRCFDENRNLSSKIERNFSNRRGGQR